MQPGAAGPGLCASVETAVRPPGRSLSPDSSAPSGGPPFRSREMRPGDLFHIFKFGFVVAVVEKGGEWSCIVELLWATWSARW